MSDHVLLIFSFILWVGLMWATVKSMKKEPEHKHTGEEKHEETKHGM